MSQRNHYGSPPGAPRSHIIPHKHLDPYYHPSRLHRTGDSALNTRMSSDIPPAWGPEMQDVYPILKWKQDVNTWFWRPASGKRRRVSFSTFSFMESQRPIWRVGLKIQRRRYGEPNDYKTETEDTEPMSAGKRCEESEKKARWMLK